MSKAPTSIFAAAVLLLAAAHPAVAEAGGLTKPVGWGPLTSAQAAKLVNAPGWGEPRPGNRVANHTVPSQAQLHAWRASCRWPSCGMPYARYVNGQFRGTTNEIIQWAGHKWGFRPQLLRAVATVESWWHQRLMLGDKKYGVTIQFGLYQVRRPWHCTGNCTIARNSNRLQRRLLRRHPPRVLRREGDVVEHGGAREAIRVRRPLGEASGRGSRGAGGPARRSQYIQRIRDTIGGSDPG